MVAGKLLALEGIDGSGTTTQAARLAAELARRSYQVLATREPSSGPIGRLLRRALGGENAPIDPGAMALLFAADRLDHLAREILPALARGEHVVSDRYLLSSLAYQSVDVERDWVVTINARARPPDLTLLLEVPVELAQERRRGRGGSEELYDAGAVQKRVAANYLAEAERARRAGAEVVIIDATPDAERVFAALWRAVEAWLAE